MTRVGRKAAYFYFIFRLKNAHTCKRTWLKSPPACCCLASPSRCCRLLPSLCCLCHAQDIFRRLTNPTLKKLYRFVLKRLVGRFLDDDISLEVRHACKLQQECRLSAPSCSREDDGTAVVYSLQSSLSPRLHCLSVSYLFPIGNSSINDGQ